MDPRLLQLLRQVPVRRFDNGGEVIDLGSFDDLADVDLGNIDFSNLFGDGEADLSALLGDQTGGGHAGETVDMLTKGGAGEDVANLFGDISGDQPINLDELNKLAGTTGVIDLGSYKDLADVAAGITQDEMRQGITATGNVQNAGGDTVIIGDDGTALGFSAQTGEPYELSKQEVDNMVKAGVLNSYGSGYNTMTGGNKIAPGGGKQVTTSDGKKFTVMPDGKVVGSDGKVVTNTNTIKETIQKAIGGGGSGGSGGGGQQGKSELSSLLPLLLLMMMMNRQQPQTTGQAVIPKLSAERTALPYQQVQRAPGYRPGQGGVQYVSDVAYKPMATGGIADLTMMAGGGTPVGGKLLKGPGDGVSDSIPATIGGTQPARLARGEFVVDARTVSELGNGSTEAGAEKLYKMMDRVHSARKKAGRGKDSGAAKYLPA